MAHPPPSFHTTHHTQTGPRAPPFLPSFQRGSAEGTRGLADRWKAVPQRKPARCLLDSVDVTTSISTDGPRRRARAAARIMGGKGGYKKQVTKAEIKKNLPRGPKVPGPRHTKAKAARAKAEAAAAAAQPNFAAAAAVDDGEEGVRPMTMDASTSAGIKAELRRGKVAPTPPGAAVMYLGHIPHGFYEEQMRGFFSQFGTVSRLRLARNKKTGKSKHFAFIEFKHAEVAKVVAKSMNGYLMYSKVLQAQVMAPDKVHPEMFKGATRPFKVVDRLAVVRKVQNATRSPAQAAKREQKLVKGERKKRSRLAAAGIEYEFGGYAAAAAAPGKRTRGVLSGAKEAEAAAAAATRPSKKAKAKPAEPEPEPQPPAKRAKKAAAAEAAATEEKPKKAKKPAAAEAAAAEEKPKKAKKAKAADAAAAPATKKPKKSK